jgi:hypothetical protein
VHHYSLVQLFVQIKTSKKLAASGFIFFYEEDKNFSVGLFNLLNNPYRKIELPIIGRFEHKVCTFLPHP